MLHDPCHCPCQHVRAGGGALGQTLIVRFREITGLLGAIEMSNMKLCFSCYPRCQSADETFGNTPETAAEPVYLRARGSSGYRGIAARCVRCHPPPAHKTIRFHLQHP
ncbi:hypothetical protein M9458_027334, partial [Cirrhinus mrigala]